MRLRTLRPVRPAAWIAVLLAIGGCMAQSAPSIEPSAVAAAGSPTAAAPSSTPATTVPKASPATSFPPAPTVLDVACAETGTTVASDTVAAQPDGVHFSVHGGGNDRTFTIEGVGGGDADSETAWDVRPGPVRIACTSISDPSDTDWISVTVVDPQGLHPPALPTCVGESVSGIIDYAQGARGDKGDPVTIARRQASGLLPGDVVERAGYPATPLQKVRIVRDGVILAVGTYRRDGAGGWLREGVDRCTDTGIQW